MKNGQGLPRDKEREGADFKEAAQETFWDDPQCQQFKTLVTFVKEGSRKGCQVA